jgi:hypothetical protein
MKVFRPYLEVKFKALNYISLDSNGISVMPNCVKDMIRSRSCCNFESQQKKIVTFKRRYFESFRCIIWWRMLSVVCYASWRVMTAASCTQTSHRRKERRQRRLWPRRKTIRTLHSSYQEAQILELLLIIIREREASTECRVRPSAWTLHELPVL